MSSPGKIQFLSFITLILPTYGQNPVADIGSCLIHFTCQAGWEGGGGGEVGGGGEGGGGS